MSKTIFEEPAGKVISCHYTIFNCNSHCFLFRVERDDKFDLIYKYDDLLEICEYIPADSGGLVLAAIYNKETQTVFYFSNEIPYVIKDRKTVSVSSFKEEISDKLAELASRYAEKNRKILLKTATRLPSSKEISCINAISLYIENPGLNARPKINIDRGYLGLIENNDDLLNAIKSPDDFVNNKFNTRIDSGNFIAILTAVTTNNNDMWEYYQIIRDIPNCSERQIAEICMIMRKIKTYGDIKNVTCEFENKKTSKLSVDCLECIDKLYDLYNRSPILKITYRGKTLYERILKSVTSQVYP